LTGLLYHAAIHLCADVCDIGRYDKVQNEYQKLYDVSHRIKNTGLINLIDRLSDTLKAYLWAKKVKEDNYTAPLKAAEEKVAALGEERTKLEEALQGIGALKTLNLEQFKERIGVDGGAMRNLKDISERLGEKVAEFVSHANFIRSEIHAKVVETRRNISAARVHLEDVYSSSAIAQNAIAEGIKKEGAGLKSTIGSLATDDLKRVIDSLANELSALATQGTIKTDLAETANDAEANLQKILDTLAAIPDLPFKKHTEGPSQRENELVAEVSRLAVEISNVANERTAAVRHLQEQERVKSVLSDKIAQLQESLRQGVKLNDQLGQEVRELRAELASLKAPKTEQMEAVGLQVGLDVDVDVDLTSVGAEPAVADEPKVIVRPSLAMAPAPEIEAEGPRDLHRAPTKIFAVVKPPVSPAEHDEEFAPRPRSPRSSITVQVPVPPMPEAPTGGRGIIEKVFGEKRTKAPKGK